MMKFINVVNTFAFSSAVKIREKTLSYRQPASFNILYQLQYVYDHFTEIKEYVLSDFHSKNDILKWVKFLIKLVLDVDNNRLKTTKPTTDQKLFI